MKDSAQARAIKKYRARLNRQGLSRFEVLGLPGDRELIRSLARHLAENGPKAGTIRSSLRHSIAAEPRKAGGILAALRRSPLVGTELSLDRPENAGRAVDL